MGCRACIASRSDMFDLRARTHTCLAWSICLPCNQVEYVRLACISRRSNVFDLRPKRVGYDRGLYIVRMSVELVRRAYIPRSSNTSDLRTMIRSCPKQPLTIMFIVLLMVRLVRPVQYIKASENERERRQRVGYSNHSVQQAETVGEPKVCG